MAACPTGGVIIARNPRPEYVFFAAEDKLLSPWGRAARPEFLSYEPSLGLRDFLVAPGSGGGPSDVTMGNAHLVPLVSELLAEAFGQSDGAMAAPGAA